MFAAAIIVLRETFEAALLIGIIAAATRGIRGRGRWIGAGIAAGAVGAVIVAALAGRIAAMFEGVGQELFNATVLGVAVVMLGWHNIWMSTHGAELAASAKRLGREVVEGRRELSAVFVVVALAVLREGSETALFLYGLLSGSSQSVLSASVGGAGGLLAGTAIGMLLYQGMLKIPVRHFFTVTSGLILFLAAGLAARMAGFLAQADLIPSLKDPLWDSSSMLSVTSPVGAFMHVLVGYEATPSGMQVIFYAVTAAVILVGMLSVRRAHER